MNRYFVINDRNHNYIRLWRCNETQFFVCTLWSLVCGYVYVSLSHTDFHTHVWMYGAAVYGSQYVRDDQSIAQ